MDYMMECRKSNTFRGSHTWISASSRAARVRRRWPRQTRSSTVHVSEARAHVSVRLVADLNPQSRLRGDEKGVDGRWTYALLRESRALDVFDGAELARETLARFRRHRTLLLSAELLEHGGVVSEIDLSPDDEAGHSRAVVMHLSTRTSTDGVSDWSAAERRARGGEQWRSGRDAGREEQGVRGARGVPRGTTSP